MKSIIKIFKGTLVGLGSILPGISGGMIATVFNIYEELIIALNKVVKTPFKAIISIWEYLIGVIVGIALGIVLVATIFKLYPIPITMLFIGFILGGIPSILGETKGKTKNWYHYLTGVIMGLVMLSVLFLRPNNIGLIESPQIYFVYGLIGFLIALPIVVPGVSGTMILMALGLYSYMTDVLSEFIKALVTFNGQGIISNLLPTVTIAISAFVGLLLFSKVIYYFLKNHKLAFNMAILGILFVSPVNILWTLYVDNDGIVESIGWLNVISSIILFTLGVLTAYKTSKLGNNKGDEIIEN